MFLASSVSGLFKWRQFEPEVILLAVGWYLRFSLSYRDVEELLAERGVHADHVTVWRWVQRYAPEMEGRSAPSLYCWYVWIGSLIHSVIAPSSVRFQSCNTTDNGVVTRDSRGYQLNRPLQSPAVSLSPPIDPWGNGNGKHSP